MRKIWKSIQNGIETCTAILILLMIVFLFINAMCRYIFDFSFSWCEELCRSFLVVIVFLGITIVVQKRILLRIDILDTILKGNTINRIINAFLSFLGIFCGVVFCYSGILLTKAGAFSSSPSLGIPMYIIYVFVPIGYFLGTIESVLEFVEKIKDIRQQNGAKAIEGGVAE